MHSVPTQTPSTDELISDLRDMLGSSVSLTARKPWDYCSSYPIEELELSGNSAPDGTVLFKNLSPSAMLSDARRVKIEYQCNPLREIEVYRNLLVPNEIDVPKLIGAVVKREEDKYWLFLQKVDGVPLWQVGDFAAWINAAKWLAKLHALSSPTRPAMTSLMKYDGDACRRWLQRADQYSRQDSDNASRRKTVSRLVKRRDAFANEFDSLPTAFVHGEYYPSNILAQTDENHRIRVVDWEMAGIGPGLLDLASLIAGKWTDKEREDLVASYQSECDLNSKTFNRSLTLCRLYLAIHSMGWSPNWSPPKEHALDWYAEADRLADELGYN